MTNTIATHLSAARFCVIKKLDWIKSGGRKVFVPDAFIYSPNIYKNITRLMRMI